MTFRVGIVAGDREDLTSHIAHNWLGHCVRLGYMPMIASSWPETHIVNVYGGLGGSVFSVDSLLGFNPKVSHAHRQLHRRIALAVRLGGIARIFAANPTLEAVVVADSDVLMIAGPEEMLALLGDADVYSTQLRFARAEAPAILHMFLVSATQPRTLHIEPQTSAGWISDLGLIISRKGFEKLQRRLLLLWKMVFEQSVPEISVHGLLMRIFRLCELTVNTDPLDGFYLLPDGPRQAVLKPEMPEDAWLNCGHVVSSADGQPLFMHACMKTRLELPEVSIRTAFEVMERDLSRAYGLRYPAHVQVPELGKLWVKTAEDVIAVLKGAGIANPRAAFWQDYGAMQRASEHYVEHGVLPQPKGLTVIGEVTELSHDIVAQALLAA